jgi:DNA-binding MarR family transcriptional regulator
VPRLRTEIKQRKPFTSLHEEVFLALVRTADRLRAREAELLDQFALTAAQYNVLRILRGAGDDGHPCAEIGARMIAREPDVTRLVDRLEARGLVRRERSTADRRVVQVRILTPALELLGRIDGPIAALAPRMLSALSPRELRTLDELLAKARSTA